MKQDYLIEIKVLRFFFLPHSSTNEETWKQNLTRVKGDLHVYKNCRNEIDETKMVTGRQHCIIQSEL